MSGDVSAGGLSSTRAGGGVTNRVVECHGSYLQQIVITSFSLSVVIDTIRSEGGRR